MEQMNITSAQYRALDGTNTCIVAMIDNEKVLVPLSEGNRHYAEIMRQVDEGTLTIQDADD